MSKKITTSLIILIVISIAGYFVVKNSDSVQSGYDSYQQGDYERALNIFSKHAEKSDQAAFSLAMMYWNGSGTEENRALAKKWLIKSANAGNKNALYNLGIFRYKNLIADNPHDLIGYASIEEAAKKGVVEAQEFMANHYLNDDNNILPQNIDKARHYSSLAAEQNSEIGQLILAYIITEHENNPQKAIEILEPLANNHSPFAAFLLASIYSDGKNGIERDPKRAQQYQEIGTKDYETLTQDQINMVPVPLTVYGSLTLTEQQQLLMTLDTLAKKDNAQAMYQLFNIYNNGNLGIKVDKNKALSYLQALIEKNDPQALYLNYITTKQNPNDLISAANSGYSPAAFHLYRIYSYYIQDKNFKFDEKQAEKYLNQAAKLNNKDAFISLVYRALHDENYPTAELNAVTTKYATKLLHDYPNDPMALLYASNVYANKGSELYNPKTAFDLNEKAFQVSSEGYIKTYLAYKYAYGEGVAKDLAKAFELYNDNIIRQDDDILAKRHLVELYYDQDISAYIKEEEIISYILSDIEKYNNHQQAYYYADYLLKTDALKNKDKAFKLYQDNSSYNLPAKVHYAKALIDYQDNQQAKALTLITEVLNQKNFEKNLSEKDKNNAIEMLFKYGLNNREAKKILLTLGFTKNNQKAKQYVSPLINQDADITYQYGIYQLANITDIDKVPDEELREMYNYIFRADELGSLDASLYIAQNLINNNYDRSLPYFSKRFQEITHLEPNDLFTWYNRCADLGNNECLYRLGHIYEYGEYKTPVDYEKALSYYQKINIPNYHYVETNIENITRILNEFEQLKQRSAAGDTTASYAIATAYKKGEYGQKVNPEKWLEYLDISANGGDKFILQEAIRYYSQDALIEDNKDKILRYYNIAIDNGNEQMADMLAQHYYDGSKLVTADRQKAREYFIKSGSVGQRQLAKLESFDKNLKLAANNPEAAYEVGYAYLYGNGIHQNDLQAKHYLHLAAQKDHHEATLLYANLLQVGRYDLQNEQWIIKPNWQEAIRWLEKIPNDEDSKKLINFYQTVVIPAQNNDADAMKELASWYVSKNNLFAAGEWFEKSAQAGNLPAIQGVMFFSRMPDEKKQALLLQGAQQGDLYSRDKFANMTIESPEIATNAEQYQLAINFLEANLNSDDKSFSRDAYYTLKNLYKEGYTLGDGTVLREPSPTKYVELLEKEVDKRSDAINGLYFFYKDNDLEKALGYLDKEYPNDELGVTEKRYFAYFPGNKCQNKYADADKSAYYLTQWLEKSAASGSPIERTSIHLQRRSKNMGDIYFNGQCNTPKDIDKAIQWYKVSLSYNPHYALNEIYDAYLAKGDLKEAYYYALKLKKDTELPIFNTLSDAEKKAISQRYQDEHSDNVDE
ncbi:tetratricopeptide repeat protein [Providencia sneebia]|uniref:Sel1 repeat family protein n=1 Tax=Providencia sneebia DSM 19967 TaxID=1141660 RepID=K8WKD5_9GAMM|nr:SEL1-like repeat protein [Providencia sneebia]EKT61014.1 hypothetical protein OO7_02966 [Providencia sneebia DSM 19967]